VEVGPWLRAHSARNEARPSTAEQHRRAWLSDVDRFGRDLDGSMPSALVDRLGIAVPCRRLVHVLRIHVAVRHRRMRGEIPGQARKQSAVTRMDYFTGISLDGLETESPNCFELVYGGTDPKNSHFKSGTDGSFTLEFRGAVEDDLHVPCSVTAPRACFLIVSPSLSNASSGRLVELFKRGPGFFEVHGSNLSRRVANEQLKESEYDLRHFVFADEHRTVEFVVSEGGLVIRVDHPDGSRWVAGSEPRL